MVSLKDFDSVIEKLSKETILSLDCETTGLRVWQKDRLFSIIIATMTEQFYFNFNDQYPGIDPQYILVKELIPALTGIFNPDQVVFMANAKFDMACLYQEGVEVSSQVIDVLMLARLLYNEHLDYKLESCARRFGVKKDDAVEEYISKEHLWEWVQIPGKKQRGKNKFFDRVPLEIIVPYGKTDAKITLQLGQYYVEELNRISSTTPEILPNISKVVENEVLLTKVCFEMEKVGIKIDKEYCERAYDYEAQKCEVARTEFEKICGQPFIDSNKALAKAFASLGLTGAKTQKGNPSFTDDALKSLKHPLAQTVQRYREAYKKATTYYQSFLYFKDQEGLIHANMKQSGTSTGRFSYDAPNLQNIPKEETDGVWKVRKAFIPREGFCFVEFDYKAMEYRLMAEYAAEKELTRRILAGEDVHEATGQMMGVKRQFAKTLNFMLLYGGGAQKLADALGLDLLKAKELKARYFSTLPAVKNFISEVTRVTTERGFVFNWLGRRCHFPDRDFAYKAPNALIQGGCADLVKVAMVKISQFLRGHKSRMVLQVHDSLLFEMPESEFYLIPEIKKILETTFPSRHLTMEVSVSHSWKNWGEMIDEIPAKQLHCNNVTTTGNQIQKQSTA